MEKKWLWQWSSSEGRPGESKSSGSFSSHSVMYSDEQDASRESQNEKALSQEVTSKAVSATEDNKVTESVKSLTEKLSAALVNISAKEALVKQHAKVAEEAVAGWEKAENEVASLKQQKMDLEVQVSNLDGVLKECVRQLRQASDEEARKERDWESAKAELEDRIQELQAQLEAASKTENSASLLHPKLEEENTFLKQELASRIKELEIVTIERDLSTRAAEAASKLQLESVKKVAKLEAECRRLQSVSQISSSIQYCESLTDCAYEPSSSDPWASALIAELDQFRKDKPLPAKFSFEIDMMDDFLEMERLAASADTTKKTATENSLKPELDSLNRRAAELAKKLEQMEAENSELEGALDESRSSLEEARRWMAEAEAELQAANQANGLLKTQLINVETEARTVSANADSLRAEIEKERIQSAVLRAKCEEMENELMRNTQETEIRINTTPQIKEEDLAGAANKLAECQKTIASLGRQLKSLATADDFLTDNTDIPGYLNNGQLLSYPARTWRDKDSPQANGKPAVDRKSRNGFRNILID